MDRFFLLAAGAALMGYLLGSVPFGLVLARLAGYGDIRRIGSGNIGATNVLRTGNKGLAALTLLFDSGKGGAAVLAVLLLLPAAGDGAMAGAMAGSITGSMAGAMVGTPAPFAMLPLLAGGGAMLGHTAPVWLGFKGGKGVATALGVLLAAAWPVGLAACGVWLATAILGRISSLAALVALGTAPVLAALIADPARAVLAGFIAVLVFARHHQNIRRLLRGQEPRIGHKTAAGD